MWLRLSQVFRLLALLMLYLLLDLLAWRQLFSLPALEVYNRVTVLCSFVAHVLRIRQHPTALPTYYRATVQYHGHVTAFGMSGVWSLDEPQQQEGVWSMYPIHKNAQQSFTRSAGRAETGESGQSAGWDLYQLQ